MTKINIKVKYKKVKDVPEKEIQRGLDKAFDILFEKVINEKNLLE
jgi:hypothetical protein